MKKTFFFISFLIGFLSLGPLSAQTFNSTYEEGMDQQNQKLQLSLSGDILLKYGGAGSGLEDHLHIRELELMMILPVHDKFEALASFAMHLEDGDYALEAHEAYISTSRLIPRTTLRLGQFFLGIGRLNRMHRHEWPFISAPKVHREFFDEEALIDTGLEATFLLPTPFYWSITAGITSGWTFGHAHDAGEQPRIPTHYLRSAHYWDLPGNGGISVGLNYLGRRDSEGTHFHYTGLDLTSKWRRGKRLKFLLQGEFWSQIQKPQGQESEVIIGAYLYPQYAWHDHWSFGVRGDYHSNLSLKDVLGRSRSNGTYAIVPTLKYQPSERIAFKAAYTAEYEDLGALPAQWNHSGEFQITFTVGKHPAHEF